MDRKAIREQQTLVWAGMHAGEKMRDLEFALRRLNDLLGGAGKGGRVEIEALVSEGALTLEDGRLEKGASFEAALAARAPARRPLTEEDIAFWTACSFIKRLPLREELGASTVMQSALSELLTRQAEGSLPKVEVTPDRVLFADRWNAFVETGLLHSSLVRMLRNAVDETASIQSVTPLQEDDLAEMVTHLNTQIAEGFTPEVEVNRLHGAGCIDQSTGEELSLGISGWGLTFYTEREEDDYDRKPVDLADRPPHVVHAQLPTGGDLCLVSSRGCTEVLSEALYAAHVDLMDEDENLNSDAGSLIHARKTHARSGAMAVYVGDYFPKPIRNIETGEIVLANYGETVTPAEALQLEAEGDADFANGYFMIETGRHAFIEGSHLDTMVLAPRAVLIDLLVAHSDLDATAAEALIAGEEAGEFRKIYRLEDVPETLHLYMPHGRAQGAFEEAFDGSQLRRGLYGGQPGMLLSTEPVSFGPQFKVRDIELEAPRTALATETIEP